MNIQLVFDSRSGLLMNPQTGLERDLSQNTYLRQQTLLGEAYRVAAIRTIARCLGLLSNESLLAIID